MENRALKLRASSVSKRFGNRILFRDLSLSLTGGETLAITGPNGSGKSTLLRILGGLLPPSSGRVELLVGAQVLDRSEHPLHVGIVAPYVNLYHALTAAENLRFIARLRGINGRMQRVETLLNEVGLGDRAADQVDTFSSGMHQRLRIAAALLPEPDILLLDEPSITLDESGAEVVCRLIDTASAQGRIVIVATNSKNESKRCASVCAIDTFS